MTKQTLRRHLKRLKEARDKLISLECSDLSSDDQEERDNVVEWLAGAIGATEYYLLPKDRACHYWTPLEDGAYNLSEHLRAVIGLVDRRKKG